MAVGYYKSVKGREKQDKRLEGDGGWVMVNTDTSPQEDRKKQR